MRDFSADYILFQSFEIRGYILNNHKILIGLDSCFKSSLLIFWVTFEIYFYFSAADVVLCGNRKKPPRTSSIMQIIFYFSPLRSDNIF